ncbi:NADH-ubiquinone oxidoreductase-F iron-sulfur binding region domain-containing protein [Nitriliruptor alkaliphilus]|uniref:NADH-ubiquinone oxidoreductase-F iron-sulfur binding region domain-containing protein n=1 Tax=Nitriliruptor alkaliphilus TaxID=427918 RepID=UPI0006985BE9|nr:NADH-ubiquinone oxidoreductase-F iron-sulfur binding region domain-containing protein [Nitriliruptor alkaliphilus]
MTDTDRLLPARPVRSLDEHLAAGGGAGLARALELDPDQVIELVDAAGLRGRGGAGFPTARKWRGVLANAVAAEVAPTLVANGAEGEPGTYKDRVLLEQQPYAFLEGVCIAMYATGAATAHIATKAKFTGPVAALTDAFQQVQAAGWPGADRIEVTLGPDAYLFGEETGMLRVIEGALPLPQVTRPFEEGLFATTLAPNPTVVNNVETFSHVARIVAEGPDWFREAGTEASPGTMLFSVVGDVESPGTYELAMGTPLRTLLEDIAGARDVKVVAPGVSSGVITPGMLDTPLDFDAMRKAGTGLGSGGFVVYDSSRSIVDVLAVLLRFLAVESCGQCNPCKLGNIEMYEVLAKIQRGEATRTDLERMLLRSHTVTDQNRCYLPIGSQALVGSTVEAFVDEFVATVEAGEPTPADLPVPLIDHIDEATGRVTFHERYHLKRSDWSYADQDPGEQRLAALRGEGPA